MLASGRTCPWASRQPPSPTRPVAEATSSREGTSGPFSTLGLPFSKQRGGPHPCLPDHHALSSESWGAAGWRERAAPAPGEPRERDGK